MVLLGFPHFNATESHNKTNATRRTAWKKFALAERQRARNFLIFRCGCKQETLGCKRLKIKRRISFATRLISLRPSHANFDFLFSNFAVLPWSQRFFLNFPRVRERRMRVAKRRERKTSGYLGPESHFHADAGCQTRQIYNYKRDQWQLSNHVLISR